MRLLPVFNIRTGKMGYSLIKKQANKGYVLTKGRHYARCAFVCVSKALRLSSCCSAGHEPWQRTEDETGMRLRPVDALQGADVTEKLNELLNKYMPSEEELNLRAALEAEAAGDLGTALQKVAKVYSDNPKNSQAKFIYIRLCLKQKNLDKAKELIDSATREEKESKDYQDLLSALNLALKAQESPELALLQEKYKEHPDDMEILKQLAAALSEAGKRQQALDLLFEAFKKDTGNAQVKQLIIDILNTMQGDPLQSKYRRNLYTLMY